MRFVTKGVVATEFRALCAERERYILAFGSTFSGRYANTAFFVNDRIEQLLDGYLALSQP